MLLVRFLSKLRPVFFLRPRDYSKSVPVAPFIVNYSGALFREYPGPWQVRHAGGHPAPPSGTCRKKFFQHEHVCWHGTGRRHWDTTSYHAWRHWVLCCLGC